LLIDFPLLFLRPARRGTREPASCIVRDKFAGTAIIPDRIGPALACLPDIAVKL
jgi:hypothetical protein